MILLTAYLLLATKRPPYPPPPVNPCSNPVKCVQSVQVSRALPARVRYVGASRQ